MRAAKLVQTPRPSSRSSERCGREWPLNLLVLPLWRAGALAAKHPLRKDEMSHSFTAIVFEHHGVIRWLVERLLHAQSAPAKAAFFDQFAKALGGHLSAVDKCILPFLRTSGATGLREDQLARYVVITEALADLLTIDVTSESFDLAFGALASEVLALVDFEQKEMAPVVTDRLGADGCADMTAGLQLELRRFMGDEPFGFLEPTQGRSTALIDEARLVLSTLAQSTPPSTP